MDSYHDGESELEYIDIYGCCNHTDGAMGEEERIQIEEGVWGQIQEEEIYNVARHLLAALNKPCIECIGRWIENCGHGILIQISHVDIKSR